MNEFPRGWEALEDFASRAWIKCLLLSSNCDPYA